MGAFGRSQSIRRLEDVRLLTGHGRYVDDIAPTDALRAVFLRAPVAHAEIAGLDAAEARRAPGVALVLTAADLAADGVELAMEATVLKNRDGTGAAAPRRPVLAEGRVRHVGEPVALVVAETLAAAKDAAERIAVTWRELPVKLDLAPGGPALHPAAAPANVAIDWELGDAAAVEAAFARAAHRVRIRLEHNRILVSPMEPRGCFAVWEAGRLHLCYNGQGVWGQKEALVRALGLRPEQVRVTTPDVGGGFGMKAVGYPEYIAVAQAARRLGRPVRWMSERTEAMLSDTAGRDLVSEAEMAFDSELRILGYRVTIHHNLGAYNSEFAQYIQTVASSRVAPGIYAIGALHVRSLGYYTNTTPVDAYRGAGRPEAIYTLERTLDLAARQLAVSPWELRRRNLIRSFPYRTLAGETYDSGDFPRVLARLEAEADAAGFPARRAAAAARGRLRGLGLACYIEAILGDPSEGARIEFAADGTVNLYVGTQSNGQGHETVYAQFLSDRTGIPVEAIRVIQGDSDRIAEGGGTGGSRSVTVQSLATDATVAAMAAAFAPFLAAELGVEPGAVTLAEGAFRAPGTNRTVTVLEAAALARARGRADLLVHAARARLPGRTFPNGAHAAEVEVDPETGTVAVVRYTVTDDFGNVLHPMLAEGQVHGGIAQGIGQALTERTVYDPETGQLLTASFMDYALPRADDLPGFRFTTEPSPSAANPLGMKGCGEAGTVGALGAIGNAVLDALWPVGVRQVDMPCTPQRVWGWIEAARRAPGG